MNSELRAPATTLANKSYPFESVPNMCPAVNKPAPVTSKYSVGSAIGSNLPAIAKKNISPIQAKLTLEKRFNSLNMAVSRSWIDNANEQICKHCKQNERNGDQRDV